MRGAGVLGVDPTPRVSRMEEEVVVVVEEEMRSR